MPAAGKPTFAIGADEMEMGVGIHGEPGRKRVKLVAADAIAKEMVGAICDALVPPSPADREEAGEEYRRGEVVTTAELLSGLRESLRRWEGQP